MLENVRETIEKIKNSNFVYEECIGKENNAPETAKYKVGVHFTQELEELNEYFGENILNNLQNAEFMREYILFKTIRNNLLETVEENNIFEFNYNYLEKQELFLYFVSCNDFDNAFKIYNYNVEFIGCDAYTSSDVKHVVDSICLDFNITKRGTKEYVLKNYKKVEQTIPLKLTNEEVLFLYGKMKKVIFTEECDTLRNTHVKAICNFMLNYSNVNLLPFYVAYANIFEMELYTKIETDRRNILPVFYGDILYAKGICLMNQFEWEDAYNTYLRYNFYRNERIKCLMGMKKREELEMELIDFMKKVLRDENVVLDNLNMDFLATLRCDAFSVKNKMILSNIFIKLGHLYMDVRFYDVAHQIYADFKPYRAKAMFYFTNKKFKECAQTCEALLEMNSELPDVNFNYGCCLMERERYGQAAKIFKKLKFQDPMNINVVKNLTYCYCKMEDVDKALENLRGIAKTDQSALRNYLVISLKNNYIDNVKWGFHHVKINRTVEDILNYLVFNNIISKEEIMKILENNQHYDANETYNF